MGIQEGGDYRLGDSPVISERQLAQSAAFWSATAPMIESFTRLVNSDLLVRDHNELVSVVRADRRAFVNECAFDIFCDHRHVSDSELPMLEIAREVGTRLARLDRHEPPAIAAVDEQEAAEAIAIARRLEDIIVSIGVNVVNRPPFRGCGFLSGARGDLLVDDCLVEIKAGKRLFRSEDVRQVLAYLALNHAGKTFGIECVALVNPRMGFHVVIPVSTLARRVASTSSDELFDKVAFLLSSGSLSR